MNKRLFILWIITGCYSIVLKAQDYTIQWQYIESYNEELNAEELNEVWDYYSQNPINLNKKQQLHLLTHLQLLTKNEITLIQDYCRQNQLSSIFELQKLDISITSLRRIRIFITNNRTTKTTKPNSTNIYTGLQSEAPLRRGISNKEYLGSALKINFKYRQEFRSNWKVGTFLEKDLGEPMIYSQRRINNLGFSVQYLDEKKQILFGKYDLSIGEGLLIDTRYRINNPYFLSHTANTFIKPSTSPKEYNYFNGLAVKWDLSQSSIQLFSSFRKASGAKSYDKTGLFRTKHELDHYKTNKEKLVGLSLTNKREGRHISWAGIVYNTSFNTETKFLQSISYSKHFYNIHIAGEMANQDWQDIAILQKMNIAIGRNSFITTQYRYRAPTMINTFNSDYRAFSNSYEKGIYYALLHNLNSIWAFKLAFDNFKSTQLQSKNPHYPAGNKTFLELRRHTEKNQFTCQYQYKKTNQTNTIQKLRGHYQSQLNPQLRWSSKLYFIFENQKINSSIQENFNWKSLNKKMKISLSASYFNTNNEAVYWQAPHFYGLYNARFLSGNGSIYSLAFQKKNSNNIKVGLQVICLNYEDRAFIGTGNEIINSSHKLEIALFLKWKN